MTQLSLRDELSRDQREKLQRLLRSGESLMVILSEILDYSKIEANKVTMEDIDVNIPVIFSDIASFFNAVAAENGIEFITDLEKLEHPMVIGDPTRLRQVINNLCNNAVKFTNQGYVKIIVQSSLDENSNAHLKIEVTDTGIGMTQEAADKIFQPFTQAEGSTSRKFGGTGLGLTISKNLIELMGGNISVSSEPGVGTSFIIDVRLPVSHTILENEPTQELIDHKSIRPLSALVVDDNDINVDLLSWMLEEWGHNVISAENGKQAIEVLKENEVDIIFMDFHMPVMNGQKATEKIRMLDSPKANTIIIGCTADAFKESTDTLLASGQNDVISKPIIEKELHAVLEKYFKNNKLRLASC